MLAYALISVVVLASAARSALDRVGVDSLPVQGKSLDQRSRTTDRASEDKRGLDAPTENGKGTHPGQIHTILTPSS
jgi:hypothetical protein